MRRITEFEGLRAILAWWVVGSHILPYSGFVDSLPPVVALIKNGSPAVDVFIILSGFVIFFLLDSNSEKNYWQFLTERFFRIYPLFIIAFVLAILLMPLKIFVFSQGSWHDPGFVTKMLSQAENGYKYFAFHILTHLFILHGVFPDEILPDSSIAFLAPTWSISLEWQFYLIAPLLLILIRRSLIASSLVFGLIIIAGKLLSNFHFDLGAFLPLKFDFFAVGICSYFAYRFSQRNPGETVKYFTITSALLIICSTLLIFSPYKIVARKAIPMIIWSITFSAVIAQSIQFKFVPFSMVSKCLNNSILQKLGKISYSTYLTHALVLWVLMGVSMTVFPDINKNTIFLVLCSVGSVSIIATSFIAYYWIEQPFIRFGKRIVKQLGVKKIVHT